MTGPRENELGQLAKIRQYGGKERLKISKVARFESDLLKNNEDKAPQSRVILRDVLYGGAQVRALIHTNVY